MTRKIPAIIILILFTAVFSNANDLLFCKGPKFEDNSNEQEPWNKKELVHVSDPKFKAITDMNFKPFSWDNDLTKVIDTWQITGYTIAEKYAVPLPEYSLESNGIGHEQKRIQVAQYNMLYMALVVKNNNPEDAKLVKMASHIWVNVRVGQSFEALKAEKDDGVKSIKKEGRK